MVQRTDVYPSVRVDTAGKGVVSSAGGVLLTETVRVSGLGRELSAGLSAWRSPLARHDPAKVLIDLAVSLALGGDCLADIALLRAEPELFGGVASDPTVSRTIDRLADDPDRVLAAIDRARALARGRAWSLAGRHAPDHAVSVEDPLVVDLDATLVTAHSEKEQARPTFKKGFGFRPLWTFIDHGPAGSGEPAAVLLRTGSAGSNTAADHITVVTAALAQLPRRNGENSASSGLAGVGVARGRA
jgi:nucleotide-binding universal stress UspA family protein